METHNYDEITLDNGLIVKFIDHSTRYFGNFHHVRLEAACEVPLTPQVVPDESLRADALKHLKKPLVYRRHLTHMGVPGEEVERAKQALVENFLRHSAGYLSAEGFFERFVLGELRKKRLR